MHSNRTRTRCIESCDQTSEDCSRKNKTARVDADNSLITYKFSGFIHKIDWKTEGFSFWQEILEKGYAFIKIENLHPVQFKDIESSIKDQFGINDPKFGYKKTCGVKKYYHRLSDNFRLGLPKLSSKVCTNELEIQLNSIYKKLFQVSSEVLSHLCGEKVKLYKQECLENELKKNEQSLLNFAPDLVQGDKLTDSDSNFILNTYKKIGRKRRLISQINSNPQIFGIEPCRVLFSYPPGADNIGPDYLCIEQHLGGSFEEYSARGLLSIVFCFQEHNEGRLEVKTRDGEWINIHKDIYNQEGLCFVVPGHQLEVLSSGLYKATVQRVIGASAGLMSFSLEASESETICGQIVADINKDWEKKCGSLESTLEAFDLAKQSGQDSDQTESDDELNLGSKDCTPLCEPAVECSANNVVLVDNLDEKKQNHSNKPVLQSESSIVETKLPRAGGKTRARKYLENATDTTTQNHCSSYANHVQDSVPSLYRKRCVVCVALKIGKKGGIKKGTNNHRFDYKKHSTGCRTCSVIICRDHWDLYHTTYQGKGIRLHHKLWKSQIQLNRLMEPIAGDVKLEHIRGFIPTVLRRHCFVCKKLEMRNPQNYYDKYRQGCRTCSVVICPGHWYLYHKEYQGKGTRIDRSLWKEQYFESSTAIDHDLGQTTIDHSVEPTIGEDIPNKSDSIRDDAPNKVDSGYADHLQSSVPSVHRKRCVVCVDLKNGKKGGLDKRRNKHRFDYKKHRQGCKTCSVIICPEHWDLYHTKYLGLGAKVESALWKEGFSMNVLKKNNNARKVHLDQSIMSILEKNEDSFLI